MDIEREDIIEGVAATLPVAALIAAFLFIGTQFSDSQGDLTATGGEAMIVAFVVFVFLMLGIGLFLSWSGGGSNSS